MPAQNFVIGNRTRFLFGLLPGEILVLDNPFRPPDVVVTLSASASANATSLAVSALSGPIAAGTPIRIGTAVTVTTSAAVAVGATAIPCTALTAGIPIGSTIYFTNSNNGGNLAVTTATVNSGATSIPIQRNKYAIGSGQSGYYWASAQTVFVSADAATGATSLPVNALTAGLSNGAIGLHYGVIALQGGTASDLQIQNQDTQSRVYGDDLAYTTGAITSASWQSSYTSNVLPTDTGYQRVIYAAQYAINGARGWLVRQDPPPAGLSVGEGIEGMVDCSQTTKNNPSDGIISFSTTFVGRGAPLITRAS